jgi:dienelactone hydrolase
MSAPSSCCISGHLHTGTPKGTEETVHGLPTYVSPGKQADKSKTVVFLADIFGFQLPNVRLLADEWADQGYYVLVPDIYQGDPIDNSMLVSFPSSSSSLAPRPPDPTPVCICSA